MTTVTPAGPAPSAHAGTRRPVALGAARSEWIKLTATRSTYWTLASTAAGMIGFGAVLSAAYARHYHGLSPAARAAFDPAAYSLSGFFLAQLAIAVLGTLAITSEYTTGTIRPTLAAMPQRGTVLAAKAAVLAAIAAATGILASLAAFFAGQAILSGKGIQAHLGDPGAIRSVTGAALYLTVTSLLALALGTLIRRTAGAIAAATGVLVILPVVVQGLPAAWQNAVTRYLPSDAGQAIIGATRFTPHAPSLSPWAGFALYCAYAAAALAAGAILLNRRDTR